MAQTISEKPQICLEVDPMQRPNPLKPDRIRIMAPPFGWIPFAFLREGYFTELTSAAKLLYLFLCLVADTQGISFYGQQRLAGLLDLGESELREARRELCRRDLVAFNGRVYQVLSLPERDTMAAPSGRKETSEGLVHIGDILSNLGRGR